jgi:hypothetical protein
VQAAARWRRGREAVLAGAKGLAGEDRALPRAKSGQLADDISWRHCPPVKYVWHDLLILDPLLRKLDIELSISVDIIVLLLHFFISIFVLFFSRFLVALLYFFSSFSSGDQQRKTNHTVHFCS